MVSEAQKKASMKWDAKNSKQIIVKFYPKEEDIHAWVKSKENQQGYIKDLIRKDMEQSVPKCANLSEPEKTEQE